MTGQTSQTSHWLSSKFEPAQSWWEGMRVDESWRSNESESCDSHSLLSSFPGANVIRFFYCAIFLNKTSSISKLTYLVMCIILGIESVISSIVDAMKETSNLGLVKESVEKLSNDVASGLAIAPEQKDQVTSEIKQDIRDTGTARVNSKFICFSKSYRWFCQYR